MSDFDNSNTPSTPEVLDEADQAALIQMAETAKKLAETRAKLAPQSHPSFDGIHCIEPDCGIEIPAARLANGRIRCTECESFLEKRSSQYRRG